MSSTDGVCSKGDGEEVPDLLRPRLRGAFASPCFCFELYRGSSSCLLWAPVATSQQRSVFVFVFGVWARGAHGQGLRGRLGTCTVAHDFQKDKRGWVLNPVIAATQAVLTGGAEECKAVHVGQIKPGGVRGNHRHQACNETFIIWGARTRFRLEDPAMEKGYAELLVGAKEVVVAHSSACRGIMQSRCEDQALLQWHRRNTLRLQNVDSLSSSLLQ